MYVLPHFCATEVTGMGKNPTRKGLLAQNVLQDILGVTTTCVVRTLFK